MRVKLNVGTGTATGSGGGVGSAGIGLSCRGGVGLNRREMGGVKMKRENKRNKGKSLVWVSQMLATGMAKYNIPLESP